MARNFRQLGNNFRRSRQGFEEIRKGLAAHADSGLFKQWGESGYNRRLLHEIRPRATLQKRGTIDHREIRRRDAN